MNTYRAIVRKTVITDAIIEISATDITDAAQKVGAYAGEPSSGRGLRIVRPHDANRNAQTDFEVIKIEERL